MQTTHYRPRIIISAPQGRSGKTTITLGILNALTNRGLKVQPFKKGPDYIDPSWHTKVTKKYCRNLDCYMMDDETLKRSFIYGSQDADISIVEGAMGLYDGFDLEGSGSTAQVAKIINAPVVFVVDTRRMTRSVAAMVMGFQQFDPEVNIAGVILNHVARARHERILRGAIEKYCGIPVIGCIPKDERLVIPDRHLGLVPAEEDRKYTEALNYIGQKIINNVDLDLLIKIANEADPIHFTDFKQTKEIVQQDKIKIGVIKDKVFSFYYPENLETLQDLGAELVYINSLKDEKLPDIDGLYIGGGFPEVFAKELDKNKNLRKDIKLKAEAGLPIYAECGGLVYLGEKILLNDSEFEMVGVFPFSVIMEDKPQGHGYTRLNVKNNNSFFQNAGLQIKGHEFHNSKIVNFDSDAYEYAFEVQRGCGINGQSDGIMYKNVIAAFNHIHSLATPEWAQGFVKLARAFKN